MANKNHYVHIQEPRALKETESKKESTRASAPACFEMLYESRDGKLCVFETGEGHLTAADSSKFA